MDQWNCIGEPPAETWETMRASCHATYNGGHHDDACRDAFHHGMDTVFNCLTSGGFKEMKDCRAPTVSEALESATAPLFPSEEGLP